MAKKRKLGRGLDALLGGVGTKSPASEPEDQKKSPLSSNKEAHQLTELPVDLVRRGKYQPRKDIDQEALEELAASIKAQGLMQPIVVRPIETPDEEQHYEIIAGERRWRASQLAGLDTIPAQIRDVPDAAAVAMALIENIQREDLNPLEEAVALTRLKEEFDLTHQEVADAVGKSRATVTNLLRLMSLVPSVQTQLEKGELEMGHARAILGLPSQDQTSAANEVVKKGLSVRQTESLVRRKLKQGTQTSTGEELKLDPDIKHLQDSLAEKVGVPVLVQHGAKGKGKLILKYNSLDELDGILSHIH